MDGVDRPIYLNITHFYRWV